MPVLECNQTVDRRKKRELLFKNRDFLRLDIHVAELANVSKNSALQHYLETSNIQFETIDRRQPLRARIAQFPDMTFVHASTPPLAIVWDRDALSADRALFLMARKGSITVTTNGTVVSRGNQAHLVLPGTSLVSIAAQELGTELAYMSISEDLLVGANLPSESLDKGEIPFSLLAPAYSFTASLCAISVQDVEEPAPLRSAADEIVRSVLRMAFGTRQKVEQSRFSEAMEVILQDYPSKDLGVDSIAEKIGVSVRLLQISFKEQGTTVTREIRKVRAAAAAKMKEEWTELNLFQLADRTGFGSVATLQRALKNLGRY